MKEEKKEPPSTEKETVGAEELHFSSTIKNAHASGTGAIKRSDEAIDVPTKESREEEPPETQY